MKGNRFGYYIREGVNSIFTHGFMSFASVCIIVACLIIMGSFTLLALNIDLMIERMGSENEILALVNETFSDSDARAIQPALQSVENVDEVYFVSRETAWENFKETYPNQSLFDKLDASVARDSYVVYVKDISRMAETQEAISKVPGIAEVNVQLEISEGFVRIRNIVAIASAALVAVLFVISLFIMSNTIKLTTFERREEIAIMKMVGATSSFIRWPFVVQGLILGFVGSLISYLMEWGLYQLLSEKLLSNSGIGFLEFLPFSSVSIPILIAFTVVGLGAGAIGSVLAIKNYLKV